MQEANFCSPPQKHRKLAISLLLIRWQFPVIQATQFLPSPLSPPQLWWPPSPDCPFALGGVGLVLLAGGGLGFWEERRHRGVVVQSLFYLPMCLQRGQATIALAATTFFPSLSNLKCAARPSPPPSECLVPQPCGKANTPYRLRGASGQEYFPAWRCKPTKRSHLHQRQQPVHMCFIFEPRRGFCSTQPSLTSMITAHMAAFLQKGAFGRKTGSVGSGGRRLESLYRWASNTPPKEMPLPLS